MHICTLTTIQFKQMLEKRFQREPFEPCTFTKVVTLTQSTEFFFNDCSETVLKTLNNLPEDLNNHFTYVSRLLPENPLRSDVIT